MGTTSQKINYAIQAVDKIAEGINNIGGNIDSQTELANFKSELDSIYNELPKVEGEGSNITLEKCKKGRMDIIPTGNINQDTTPDYLQEIKVVKGNNKVNIKGKNLWGGFTNEYTTGTEVVFTTHRDGSITAKGTVTSGTPSSITVANAVSNGFTKTLPAGTYTVSHGGGNYRIQVYKSNANLITIVAENETSQTFTLTEETTILIRLNLLMGTTIDRTVNIQLEAGSTATDYEPYIEPIEREMDLSSKNLFDYIDFFDRASIINTYYKKVFNLKSNTAYTISTNSQTSGGFANFFAESGNNLNFNPGTSSNGILPNNPRTITTGTDGKLILAMKDDIQKSSFDNKFIWLQIEEGSTETEYEPYYNYELAKIGNYQDYIYKNSINGNWYKHSVIGKIVLDGSEENLTYDSTLNRIKMSFNLQTQNWSALALTLCDHFTSGDTEVVDRSFNITRTDLYFKNVALTSLNDWKTWLESNNTSVYYILATPTDIEITETALINQLEDLYKIKAHDGTNIIEVESEEENAQMIVKASALLDTEAKIEELEERIASLESEVTE